MSICGETKVELKKKNRDRSKEEIIERKDSIWGRMDIEQ